MKHGACYFMRDQVGDRVREIMVHPRTSRGAGPALWPMAALAAALTIANIMMAVPGP